MAKSMKEQTSFLQSSRILFSLVFCCGHVLSYKEANCPADPSCVLNQILALHLHYDVQFITKNLNPPSNRENALY